MDSLANVILALLDSNFLSTVVGAAVSILTTTLVIRNERRIAAADNNRERWLRWLEEQHNNYIALQEIIMRIGRTIAKIYLEFHSISNDDVSEGARISDNLAEEFRVCIYELRIASSRCDDSNIRLKCEELRDASINLAYSQDISKMEQKFVLFNETQREIMDSIGALIRSFPTSAGLTVGRKHGE